MDAPQRPAAEADLPFERCRATRWFNPGVLADTQLRVAFSTMFGAFLDKRELQAALPDAPITCFADAEELWIDYLADTGDGFDATYTMAWLLAQPGLDLPEVPRPLPRGGMLVVGGDEVYPVPNAGAYENRFVGPFRAALPWSAADPPLLLALPGNHDWYDGLTSFMRLFAQERHVGGWRTRQHRSYFAVQLPRRWWLWGVDTHLDSYLDAPQRAYFEALDVRPGDRVILCSARPGWVHAESDPDRFRTLAYVERRLIAARGARLAVALSGDYHHYARYEDAGGGQRITAGGGGAFGHPTHTLPSQVTLEIGPDDPGEDAHEPVRLTLAHRYPDRTRSLRLLRRVLLLPVWNPWFTALPAGLCVLLLWTTRLGAHAAEREAAGEPVTLGAVAASLGSPASVLVLIVVLAALVAFAKPPRPLTTRPRPRRVVKWTLGAAHWVAQVVMVVVVLWLALRLLAPAGGSPWSVATLLVAAGALGGLAGGLVTGAYLWGCNRLLRTHDNEAFAAFRHSGHKNLLRLHLDRQGGLTIYPIGVDAAGRWRLDTATGDRAAPWFAPDGEPPRPRLIEPPVTVPPRRPDAGPQRAADEAAVDTG